MLNAFSVQSDGRNAPGRPGDPVQVKSASRAVAWGKGRPPADSQAKECKPASSPQQARPWGLVSTCSLGLLEFSCKLMKINHCEVYGPGFPKSTGQMGLVSHLTCKRTVVVGGGGVLFPTRVRQGRGSLPPGMFAKGALYR